MTESNTTQADEVIVHRGYQIRLTPAGLEWIAAVGLPQERPTLIMAPDRETVIDNAFEWVDLQPAPDKTSK